MTGWASILRIGAVVALVGCSRTPPLPGLERFPVWPRVDCEESTTEGDTTVVSRSEERCRVEGERVRCSSRSLQGGETVDGWGEERFDAAGYWTVGNDVYFSDPPSLSFPADIAPGKTWTVKADMVMRGSGERYPFVKTFTVEASTACEGGLLVKTVRQVQTPGASRVDNALLYCPGSSSPRSYESQTFAEGKLIRSMKGTCVSRADP